MKRTLRRIRLDKIAAVDMPCQQHATVAIIKRAPGSPTGGGMVKAYNPNQPRDPGGPDGGRWVPAGGGIGTGREPTEDELDSIEVPTSPEYEQAMKDHDTAWNEFAEIKRTATATPEIKAGKVKFDAARDTFETAYATEQVRMRTEARRIWAEQNNPQDPNQLGLELGKKETTMNITDKKGLQAAIAKFAPATSTVADVQAIQKAATDLNAEDLLPADGPLAKAKADPAVATLTREVSILKMAPVTKSYFDGLDAAGQTAFLAKSADDQTADVEKANATDPVVFKCKNGTEIRKSDGAAMLSLAKANDDLTERLEKAEGSTEAVTFEKRAATEFPHVAAATAIAMLKSARQVGLDTDAGKDIVKSLGTMNTEAGGLFKRVGTSGSEPVEPVGVKKARATFASEVEKIASRDKIAKHVAMERAETEHPELFAEAYPPAEPAEAPAAAAE